MRSHKHRVLFSLSILFIFYGNLTALNITACGNWIAYKEEKCIKVFMDKDVQTYENAKQICLSHEVGDPSLIQINSLEEQRFIEKFLLDDNKIAEFVWLGARLNTKTNKFHWEGKTESITSYENWAKLKNNTDYECAEIIPDGDEKGKWINTSCEKKKNLVVCQKMQDWSLARLQKEFLNMKQDHELQIAKLKNSTAQLKSNPVPIGFIYVQIPSQPEPKTLWPTVEWKDVTSDYAGLFFRAEGGGSAAFGNIQEENSPRLTNARRNDVGCHWDKIVTNILPNGALSSQLCSGSSGASGTVGLCLQFTVSGGEVRPRNKAVRIWNRIK